MSSDVELHLVKVIDSFKSRADVWHDLPVLKEDTQKRYGAVKYEKGKPVLLSDRGHYLWSEDELLFQARDFASLKLSYQNSRAGRWRNASLIAWLITRSNGEK